MKKISKSVLTEIKEKNIMPIPKWQFVLKSSFVWFLFILNLILGSVGFGIILYLLANSDVISGISSTTNVVQWVFLGIPLIWIALTTFFVFVAYYNFKHTQEGYRFTVSKVLFANIGGIFLIGLLLYSSGFSEKLNTVFSTNLPFYRHTFDTKVQVWTRPNEGYLSGTILVVNSEEEQLTLRDFNDNEWNIDYGNSVIKGMVELVTNEEIKITGIQEAEGIFEASEIRPWGKGRGGLQENH